MNTQPEHPDHWRRVILREILPHVQTPGQYVGAEWNMVRKNPAHAALRFCLAFPDTYSVGMSHIGLHVLYGTVNERDDVYAERAFAPWSDMHRELRSRSVPLCSLETFTPLSRFDIVGFSLQYEMAYTNVLDMLQLGGIPLLARERSLSHPLIVAGGPCALNPEPLADFIDLFILGDAEDRIHDLADAAIELKNDPPATREHALCRLVSRVPSSYAPALYQENRSPDGRLLGIQPREGLSPSPPERIEAAVSDLEAAYAPQRPIVPFVETVHDRISIEIMRGCSRGCRFCHAGMSRRPVRARSVETIVRLAETQYAATGHDEISLASLNSSDYPGLRRLVSDMTMRFADRKVSVALPSLRVDEQLAQLPRLLSAVRKSTLTIAPEAATPRLRRVINKDISEDHLYEGVEAAFRHGWNHVKLYFMVGLPTETDEDIVAIARMAERVSLLRRRVGKPPARVNLSIAPFVPKPHTPFQWEPMATVQRLRDVRAILQANIRRRSIAARIRRPERSFLEGVFARGDRGLGRVLLRAFHLGCRLDAWEENFDTNRWTRAFAEAGIAGEDYANRERSHDEALPWSHLSVGVSDDFLRRERARAMRAEFTPDCRSGPCQECGVRHVLCETARTRARSVSR